MRPVVLLVMTLALMSSARSFAPEGSVQAAGIALAFGFLLLAALQVGQIFASLRLPRLTGYLLTGLICGPEVTHRFLSQEMVDGLGMINGIAVGLIALSAGSELNLARMKPRLRSVGIVGGIVVPLTLTVLATVLFVVSLFATQMLPFFVGSTLTQRIAMCLAMAVVLATLSPSVTLAILKETESSGPLAETVLGVVVLSDIAIIVLFALANALASGVFGAGAGAELNPAKQLAIEVFGSMGVGVVMGVVLALYVRRVKTKIALFVVAMCLMGSQVGAKLHLDVLIIFLTAGLCMENLFGVDGDVVTEGLGPAVLPVFAVFFAVAGAKLHVHDVQRMWPLAILFVLVRGSSLHFGARVGVRVANAEPTVRAWLPFALFPEVGVSVGLVVLLERHFPTWGGGARSLILSVITLNETMGPLMLKYALGRAGETGKREIGSAAHP